MARSKIEKNPPTSQRQMEPAAIERRSAAKEPTGDEDRLVKESLGGRIFDAALDSPLGAVFGAVSIVGSYLASALSIGIGIAQSGGYSESASVTGVIIGVLVGAAAALGVGKAVFEHDDADTRAMKKANQEAPIRSYAFDEAYGTCGMDLKQVEQISDAVLDVERYVGTKDRTLGYRLVSGFGDFVLRHRAALEADYPGALLQIVSTPTFAKSKDPTIIDARKTQDGSGLTLGAVYAALIRAISRDSGKDAEKITARVSELTGPIGTDALQAEPGSESEWALGFLGEWHRWFVAKPGEGGAKLDRDRARIVPEDLKRLAELHRAQSDGSDA